MDGSHLQTLVRNADTGSVEGFFHPLADDAPGVPLIAVRDDLRVHPDDHRGGGEFGDGGIGGVAQQESVEFGIVPHFLTRGIDYLLDLRKVLVVGHRDFE